MSKPDDISKEAWDAAKATVPDYVSHRIIEAIGRTIMAAKAEEREACRKDIRNAILVLPESERANGDLCDEAIAAAVRKRGGE